MDATQPALLARLDAVRVKLIADTLAANPKAATVTKDLLEKTRKKGAALSGSDLAELHKLTGSFTRAVAEALVFVKTASPVDLPAAEPEPTPPVVVKPTEPVEAPPSIPPPVESEPAAGLPLSLLNEQVFTDTSGNRVNFQNDKKEGSTEYLGDGRYRFLLRDKKSQRPSEAGGAKRRSEGSGIRVPAPVGDEIVVVKARYRFKPQAFADNMQWVMPFQLHGAGKTGSPWFAVRIEKDGWWLGTVCLSPTGSSISRRPKERFKPAPNVWHESEVRWSANRCEFYHNGKLVAEYDGPIGWEEEGVPYLKWGVYNSQGSNETTDVEIADLTVNGKPVGALA